MRNYLELKFNNNYRMEAMILHSQVDKYPIKIARVCYIAGWVSIDGNVKLTKISDDEVTFKIDNTKYNVNREYLDDINFEEMN